MINGNWLSLFYFHYMKATFTGIIILLASFSFSFAQDKDSAIISKLSLEIMSHTYAYENLRYLCKEIGPRLSGSPNSLKAVQATANMLKQGGADTVYLQPCLVTHWERGEKESGYAETGTGEKHFLKLCALGNTISTGENGIKAAVIQVSSFEELDRLGEKGIKGKMVYYNYPMNPTYIETFKAYAESGIFRRNGPSKAAKYGAVAVIIRSLASNIDEFPHT